MKYSKEMLTTLRRFNALLTKRERRLIFISMAIRVSLVAFDLVGLALLGVTASLISGAVISEASWTGEAIAWLNKFGLPNVYALFGVASVGFFVAKSFLAINLNTWVLTSVAKMEASKATELFEWLLRGDLDAKEKWSEAELAHGVMGAMDMAFSKALFAVSIVIGEVALIVGVLIFLGFQDIFALMAVGAYFALIGWLMNLLIARRNSSATHKITDANLSITNLVHETISNFRQVAPSGHHQFFTNRFATDRFQISIESSRISVISGLPRYITEIALMLSLGALLVQRAIAPDMLNPQTIGIFLAGSFRIIASMLPLQAAISLFGQVNISGRTAFEMSEELGAKANSPKPRVTPAKPLVEAPNLVLSELDFSYAGKQEAAEILSGINAEISFGDFVSITGRSGQGKSTIADLILGLRQPTSGHVLIGGIPADEIRTNNAGFVGYVPQRSQVFRGTVAENISCVDATAVDHALLNSVIDLCQLRDLVNSLERGVATEIGQGRRSLSGGQLQRISLARTLYQQPKLIVLDEATNALDRDAEKDMVKMLEALKGSVTLIAITHTGPLREICDRAFRLENGKLHEEEL
jgi:ABC-type multidrug transport system fused ATPase/permease subunit